MRQEKDRERLRKIEKDGLVSHLGGICGSAFPATTHSFPEYLYLEHDRSARHTTYQHFTWSYKTIYKVPFECFILLPVLFRQHDVHEHEILLARVQARGGGSQDWEHSPGGARLLEKMYKTKRIL